MLRRRRSRSRPSRPSTSNQRRSLASSIEITSSPITPPNKRSRNNLAIEIISSPIIKPKFSLIDIAPPSPIRPNLRTPQKFIRYEIAESPKTPKNESNASGKRNIVIAPQTPEQMARSFSIEIAPPTPEHTVKPVSIEISSSPFRSSQVNHINSSHWFQYRVEDKKRVRKSLNAALSIPNCTLLNKMYAKFAAIAAERARHMNSLPAPESVECKNNMSSPRAIITVYVLDVKYMNTVSCSMRIKFATCIGLITEDIFFRSDEEGIILLDAKTTDGMGLKCGTKLRLTYPLSWSKINGQIVIHNIFWIEAIARDVKVTRERNNLFTLRCPCQVRSSNNEPLCSSSQCDGEMPIQYLPQAPADRK